MGSHNDQHASGNGQLEPPGSGAARIDEQHAVAFADRGLMRVTGYDHVDAFAARIVDHVGDVMNDEDRLLLHVSSTCVGREATGASMPLLPRTAVTGAICASASSTACL